VAKGKKQKQNESSPSGLLCRVCGQQVVINPNGTVKLHNKPGRKGVLPCPGAGLKVAPPQSSASRSPVAPKKRAQVTLQPPDPYAGANRTPDSKTIPSQVGDRAEAKNQALQPGPKTWKCPNCLKRIDVVRGVALVQHQNLKGQRCRGSGYQIPQKSTDALDYRVAGSFEGGRGRR
jgi:hypothetical protein